MAKWNSKTVRATPLTGRVGQGGALGIFDQEEEPKAQLFAFRCPGDLLRRIEAIVKATGLNKSAVAVRLMRFAVAEAEKELVEASKLKKRP